MAWDAPAQLPHLMSPCSRLIRWILCNLPPKTVSLYNTAESDKLLCNSRALRTLSRRCHHLRSMAEDKREVPPGDEPAGKRQRTATNDESSSSVVAPAPPDAVPPANYEGSIEAGKDARWLHWLPQLLPTKMQACLQLLLRT